MRPIPEDRSQSGASRSRASDPTNSRSQRPRDSTYTYVVPPSTVATPSISRFSTPAPLAIERSALLQTASRRQSAANHQRQPTASTAGDTLHAQAPANTAATTRRSTSSKYSAIPPTISGSVIQSPRPRHSAANEYRQLVPALVDTPRTVAPPNPFLNRGSGGGVPGPSRTRESAPLPPTNQLRASAGNGSLPAAPARTAHRQIQAPGHIAARFTSAPEVGPSNNRRSSYGIGIPHDPVPENAPFDPPPLGSTSETVRLGHQNRCSSSWLEFDYKHHSSLLKFLKKGDFPTSLAKNCYACQKYWRAPECFYGCEVCCLFLCHACHLKPEFFREHWPMKHNAGSKIR